MRSKWLLSIMLTIVFARSSFNYPELGKFTPLFICLIFLSSLYCLLRAFLMTKRSQDIKGGDRFFHVSLNEVFLGVSMIVGNLVTFYQDLGEKVWIPYWQYRIVIFLCYLIFLLLMINLVKHVNWRYSKQYVSDPVP